MEWAGDRRLEKRWKDDQDADAGKAFATSRTREQRQVMRGEILDPNKDAIDGARCAQDHGKIVPADDSNALRRRGRFAKHNPHRCNVHGRPKKKIRNPDAPTHVCYYLQGGGPHYDLYEIGGATEQELNERDEILFSGVGNPFGGSLD